MEANELRIGNQINCIDYNGVEWSNGIITEIYEKQVKINGISVPLDRLNPVILTEEWLVKFGFKEIEEKLYCRRWRLNRVDFYKMISGKYPFYFRFNQVDLKIKYIHQLQNLYFALTGEELKIK